jgi:hypothetical protein
MLHQEGIMTAVVSTFLDVDLGKGRYLFFLVTWTDYQSQIKQELDKNWLPFGADLGVDGTAIRAYDQAINSTMDEVHMKPWPPKVLDQMQREQDPYMLIIDRPFGQFDPTEHRWNIIWFSRFQETPGSIYRLFGCLARKVKAGEDIFEWAGSLARKEKYAEFAKYFQVKPGLFGVTLDVKAIFQDMAGLQK